MALAVAARCMIAFASRRLSVRAGCLYFSLDLIDPGSREFLMDGLLSDAHRHANFGPGVSLERCSHGMALLGVNDLPDGANCRERVERVMLDLFAELAIKSGARIFEVHERQYTLTSRDCQDRLTSILGAGGKGETTCSA